MPGQPIWTWPREDWAVESLRFPLRPMSITATAPFTGRRSVYALEKLWVCTMTLAAGEGIEWRRRAAFWAKVGGVAGLVRVGDPTRARPFHDLQLAATQELFSDGSSFSDGTGFVSGTLPATAIAGEAAAAGSTSIVVAGLPPSLAPCFYPWDLIEIRPNGVPARHSHLYTVLDAAPTDANGRTRVLIAPELRRNVIHGDTIVLRHPTGVFRPIDDEQGVSEQSPGDVGRMGFTLVEEPEET